MLLYKTMEYLLYLALFIFMCKYAQAATLQATAADMHQTQPHLQIEDSTVATPSKETKTQRLQQQHMLGEECASSFSWMCLKVEFVKIMERLAAQEELRVLPGISVVKDDNSTEAKTSELMAEVARSYPNDPSSRLNGYIFAKIESILRSRSLRFKLFDDKSFAEARSAAVVATGRKGKFGKKGGLEALIAAGLMMKGTLLALALGAIALLAGKALITALMALTLSGVLGLKSLASGGGKSTTYEIVAKPIYTSSHSHSVSHEDGHGHGGGGVERLSASGYGGYRRSLNLDFPKSS